MGEQAERARSDRLIAGGQRCSASDGVEIATVRKGFPVGGRHLADEVIFGRTPKESVVEYEDTGVHWGRDTTEVGARRVGSGVVGPQQRCAGGGARRGVHLMNKHVTIGVRTFSVRLATSNE